MNWKFWTWPKQIRSLNDQLNGAHELRGRLHLENIAAREREYKLTESLDLARRSLARTREQGMGDEEMAEAFTGLIDNKGFEAILQLLTSEELAAMDRITEDGADLAHMKKHAGAVDALTNLHHRLIELEAQAKAQAARKPKAA